MRERDYDLAGDGRGSFLSQRRRLARLLRQSEEPTKPKPLDVTDAPSGALLRGGKANQASEGGRVMAMRRRQ